MSLSGSLKEIGLELGRLKTGTPPRLLRRTIDFSKTEPQPGDEPVPYFTYWKDDLFHVEQNPASISKKFHVEHSASQTTNRGNFSENDERQTSAFGQLGTFNLELGTFSSTPPPPYPPLYPPGSILEQ